jgi:hypothetical protein
LDFFEKTYVGQQMNMRSLIVTLDEQFRKIHENSCALIKKVPQENLYWQPRESSLKSCGEFILRSAGAVEQTFGGITCKLWDDPFEWALPETLSTNEKIIEYLNEVEATRTRAFALFKTDDDLKKEIPNMKGKLTPLHTLLIETLVRASHYQGRAFAMFKMFSDVRLLQC